MLWADHFSVFKNEIHARIGPMSKRYEIAPRFEITTPPGDDRKRSVCAACGFVDYKNPKIVVGSVAVWKEKILLCKRAIEPRKGYWTIPAGYLELDERAEDGAKREAYEEARAHLSLDCLLAVYSIPRISQVQLFYRAQLLREDVSPGPESEAVMLVDWEDIPWSDLAFPSAAWALRDYKESVEKENFTPYSNPVGEVY